MIGKRENVKKDLAIAIVVIAVVVAFCFGLAAVRPDFLSATQASHRKAAEAGVVMRVNGEPVTEREFDFYVEQLPQEARAVLATSPAGRKALANQIVKLKVLEQEGRRLGGERDPEVSSRVELGRANLLANYALSKLSRPPNDAQLRAEYEREKKNFESLEVSHILVAYRGGLVPPRQGGPAPTVAEATRRAAEYSEKARAGADFAALAREHSDDAGSYEQGGFLGAIAPASLPVEIAGVVTHMGRGEISAPLKTQYGLHVFKVGARLPQPFEQVRPVLQQRHQHDAMNRAIERLQKGAKVELDPAFFGSAKKKPS